MFSILILRTGPIHIINWHHPNGHFRTACGKSFTKNDKANTLAADNTFPGICSTCKSYYDQLYQADLDYSPTTLRSSGLLNREDIVDLHKMDLVGPRAKFTASLEYRISVKMIRYQRLVHRSKKYEK